MLTNRSKDLKLSHFFPFMTVITFLSPLGVLGQIQSTELPIHLRNTSVCDLINVQLFCYMDDDCNPSNAQSSGAISIPSGIMENLPGCPAGYPYPAFVEFEFDGSSGTHFITFDPNIPNDCAGLVDCENYSIPFAYHDGSINTSCMGQNGQIRANDFGTGSTHCVIWFKFDP